MKSARLVLMGLCAFLLVSASVQAGGVGLKEKIQKKMVNLSNIQYEPYSQQADWGHDESNQRMRREIAPPSAQIMASNSMSVDELAPLSKTVGDNKQIISHDRDRANSASMVRYAIYQANYHAELEENVVTVKGDVVFQVFEKGWTQLPLVNNQVGLIDVSVNRGSAFVTMIGDKYFLMIDKPGRYTLKIEFLIKANRERENGPGNFSFEMMPAPISQFEFVMPETGVEIFVDPAIKVEVKKVDSKTEAWAVMPNTRIVTTRWTKEIPKQEIESVDLEPKLYAENITYVGVGEGVLRANTTINYSILQSEVSSFRLSMPKDINVLNVSGADLRDWKVSAAENVQYLDVYVNFGVKGNYVLRLDYEKNVGEGSIVTEIPSIQALGVERETGAIGIAARTNVELAVNKQEHVTVIDVKELPSSIWNNSTNPILLAFKYLKHPYHVSVAVTRHEELPVLVAAVDTASSVTLVTSEGKRLTKVSYAVRNNVKQFMRMNLPQGAVIWSSFVAGKPVKPAKDKSGSILIPLEKSQLLGESLKHFMVDIVYLDESAPLKGMGHMAFQAPKIDIPVSQFFWVVSVPWEFRYYNFGGDIHPSSRYNTGNGRFGFGGGVQGRLRSAADDIGDQFSPGNTSGLSGSVVSQFTQEIRSLKSEEKSVSGILPIHIDIPQQGQQLSFSKLLVTENEGPALTMNYLPAFRKLEGFVRFIITIGLGILLILFVLRIIRRKS